MIREMLIFIHTLEVLYKAPCVKFLFGYEPGRKAFELRAATSEQISEMNTS